MPQLPTNPIPDHSELPEGRESSPIHHPRPEHYGGPDSPHEVIKCLRAWGLEGDALLWNVVKYIARAGKKGPALQDLKKAHFYLTRRIEVMERAPKEAQGHAQSMAADEEFNQMEAAAMLERIAKATADVFDRMQK